MKIKFGHLLCAFIFLATSCKKPNSNVPSKKEMLTAQPWIVQKAEEKDDTNPWVDVFPFWQACVKDNKWIFKSDMNLEYNESLLACSPNSANQVLNIVIWAFADHENKLNVEGVIYSIEQLDLNTLVIFEQEVSGGITSSRRITFIH